MNSDERRKARRIRRDAKRAEKREERDRRLTMEAVADLDNICRLADKAAKMDAHKTLKDLDALFCGLFWRLRGDEPWPEGLTCRPIQTDTKGDQGWKRPMT